MTAPRVALLHQGSPPPALGGARKPAKPGGYADSSADIACALLRSGSSVVTPVERPDPARDLDWSFPDTVEGIDAALQRGATVLWANTTLHAAHAITAFSSTDLRIVGHDPRDVELADDKAWVKARLATRGIAVPRGILVSARHAARRHDGDGHALRCLPLPDVTRHALDAAGLRFPLIVKPVRGRGSVGVRRVEDLEELHESAGHLLGLPQLRGSSSEQQSVGDVVLVESYCGGMELTFAVSPSFTREGDGATAIRDGDAVLPPVERIGHVGGVVPSLDTLPVRFTGRPYEASAFESAQHQGVGRAISDAAEVALLLHARSMIRIDSRQDERGVWRILDVNFKPSLTGPGRPGREGEVSLVGMAASRAGISYDALVRQLLQSAWPLREITRRHGAGDQHASAR